MSSVRFMFILIILYYFQAIAGGFEKPLSWKEARSECKTKNKILSPLKSVQRNLESHFRSSRSVWTSNYGLNLGCNSSTGSCESLYIEQIPKSEHYEGLCQNDYSATGIQTHFQIGSNNTFEGTCRTGIPVDVINMLTLSRAIKEMEVNTKYWINSTNIATDSFVLHCMLYTKYPNRTENYEQLTKTDCGQKYPFICSEGESYGTVISKITFRNSDDHTTKAPITFQNSTDVTTQAPLKTNQSGVNSFDGGIAWNVTAITLSVGMLLIGLVVICLIYRGKLSFGN
ncbi:uncharacterized protein LOC127730100 isoform X6 [Mytilus californianus]|uniref:uncharacterized protein LOC127730100 isoform X6 n=1 Tax=Mytilus californianus TaxID=6549 RepID=UPI0022476395|nr:uncharacterized protein LOC127730100 isoform X6 [Mytilus californianus]